MSFRERKAESMHSHFFSYAYRFLSPILHRPTHCLGLGCRCSLLPFWSSSRGVSVPTPHHQPLSTKKPYLQTCHYKKKKRKSHLFVSPPSMAMYYPTILPLPSHIDFNAELPSLQLFFGPIIIRDCLLLVGLGGLGPSSHLFFGPTDLSPSCKNKRGGSAWSIA